MGNGGSVAKPFGTAAQKVLQKPLAPLTKQQELEYEQAIFAAGCFWGVELAFQRVPGVAWTKAGRSSRAEAVRMDAFDAYSSARVARVPRECASSGFEQVRSRYTDGKVAYPTYEDVCSGTTGHTEAVCVTFRPLQVSFEELLTARRGVSYTPSSVLWDRMDPTAVNHQGNDCGTQYRSGIYYLTMAQRDAAVLSKERMQLKYAKPIATEIKPASQFWPAEDYHQQYLEKLGQSARKGRCDAINCYG